MQCFGFTSLHCCGAILTRAFVSHICCGSINRTSHQYSSGLAISHTNMPPTVCKPELQVQWRVQTSRAHPLVLLGWQLIYQNEAPITQAIN